MIKDSSGDTTTAPDTGAAANAPVPATKSCADLCRRLAECTVTLCNEDTSSSRYDAIEPSIESSCKAGCTDALVQSQITAAQWMCTFQSSCRASLDAEVCHGMGHYSCS